MESSVPSTSGSKTRQKSSNAYLNGRLIYSGNNGGGSSSTTRIRKVRSTNATRFGSARAGCRSVFNSRYTRNQAGSRSTHGSSHGGGGEKEHGDITERPPILEDEDCYIHPDVLNSGQANGATLRRGSRIESGCQAIGATLDNATVGSGCDITGATLKNARIWSSHIPEADVGDSILCKTHGSRATIASSHICDSLIPGSNIKRSTIIRSTFNGGNIFDRMIRDWQPSSFSIDSQGVDSLWGENGRMPGHDHTECERVSTAHANTKGPKVWEEVNGGWVEI